jgi:trigger factor
MDVSIKKMPERVKVSATLSSEIVKSRKKETYDKVKDNIVVNGFRKGNVPQDIAEQRMNVEELYKSLIDEFYSEVAEKYEVVTASNFAFYGDLKKNEPLTMEFVAELKPEVKTINFKNVDVVLEEVLVTEEEVNKEIQAEINKAAQIVKSEKETLENLDIAVIDFEGTLEGEVKPFEGGTAIRFEICVNELNNGHKNFIDNFEDQIVGMKIEEERNVNVKFPEDYQSKELAGKRANFKVVLHEIKNKIVPTVEELALKFSTVKLADGDNRTGYYAVEEYKESIKVKIYVNKKKVAEDTYKKNLIAEIVKESEITPIPEEMIETESEREWAGLLRRMGKTEEEMKKDHNISKEVFMANSRQRSEDIVKTTLVLEKAAKLNNISITDEETIDYVLKIAKTLKYSEEKVRRDLKNDSYQRKMMQKAALNEKVIELLFNDLTGQKSND